MADIDALRRKWFLDFSNPERSFPPVNRYEGCTVSPFTDGNLVTPLIDGQAYMKVWHDSIRAMIGQPDCEIYHSAWRIERVRTLGHSVPSSDALETLKDAHGGGVKVHLMASRHAGGFTFNSVSVIQLTAHRILTAALDNRFPLAGSNHQKVVSLKNPRDLKAVLGSIDISKTRWDRTAHTPTDPERDPTFGKQTHDTGVQIQGPAVADIELSFRDRWNDSSRTTGLTRLPPPVPLPPPLPLISTPVLSPPAAGPHSVQVLHTYGRTSRFFGYSWFAVGEFTVWAAYLKAIKKAQIYIYIEDQYFVPFDWPPCHTRTGVARDTDIIFQLGEAIKRGVKVAVVVPDNDEDVPLIRPHQRYQRNLGVNYLATVAATTMAAGGRGAFTIASLSNGTSPIYVHSKLMICDDEFVLIGSANVAQRSMSHDGELHIGVVDATSALAKELRKQLWAEHLSRPSASLDDPVAAYALFSADTAAGRGRVRPYPTAHPGDPPRGEFGHGQMMRRLIDPYAGPPRP